MDLDPRRGDRLGKPDATAIEDARKQCIVAEGKPGPGGVMARAVDLDGNGRDDWVLDFGKLACDGAQTLFCGDRRLPAADLSVAARSGMEARLRRECPCLEAHQGRRQAGPPVPPARQRLQPRRLLRLPQDFRIRQGKPAPAVTGPRSEVGRLRISRRGDRSAAMRWPMG